MVDEPATVWCLVKHVHAPFPSDKVIGEYASEADALAAYDQVMHNRQWFTEFSVERRLRNDPGGMVLKKSWVGAKS